MPITFKAHEAAKKQGQHMSLQEERDAIRRLDSTEISEGGTWFLVDATWLKHWRDYLWEGIRPDPPGPICNSRLLRSDGRPHPNLQRVTDYRGVNEAVWRFHHGKYGGGPAICRSKLDIYAPPIPPPADLATPTTSPQAVAMLEAAMLADANVSALQQAISDASLASGGAAPGVPERLYNDAIAHLNVLLEQASLAPPAPAPAPPTVLLPVRAPSDPRCTEAGEGLIVSIVPNSPWEEIAPSRPYLDELTGNESIRRRCPKVGQIAREVRLKTQELKFDDVAEPQVQMLDNDEDMLAAIVAYSHDLHQPGGTKEGNLYFEMNRSLRERSAAGRQTLLETWGVCIHYFLKGLSKLPDVERVCYRGFAHANITDKEALVKIYKNGRPIQWGAFTSTTASLQAAREFAQNAATGVIFRIKVLTGKDIGSLSFFPMEDEILLGPSHKFIVTSDTGGVKDAQGYTTIDLQQQEGEWFKS